MSYVGMSVEHDEDKIYFYCHFIVQLNALACLLIEHSIWEKNELNDNLFIITIMKSHDTEYRH